MVATYGYSYCTITEINAILSELNARLLLDDSDTGAADSALVTSVLEMATSEINLYLAERYTPTNLQTSPWVKWAAAYLAACHVATRRQLPMSANLSMKCEEIKSQLRNIQSGAMQIPELAERGDRSPLMINTTLDPRYRESKIRSQPITSSEHKSSGRHPDPDQTVPTLL